MLTSTRSAGLLLAVAGLLLAVSAQNTDDLPPYSGYADEIEAETAAAKLADLVGEQHELRGAALDGRIGVAENFALTVLFWPPERRMRARGGDCGTNTSWSLAKATARLM